MLRRLLITSHEASEARAITGALPKEEFLIRVETAGDDAFQCLISWKPECALLDANLPGKGVLDLCRRVRLSPEGERLPIMILSLTRDQGLVNRAFTAGADDFMVKPCHPTELLWRVRGLIRRYEPPPPKTAALRLGPFEIMAEQGLARVDGREIELTQTELCLLELFVRNPGRLLSRRFLLENVWGYDSSVITRVVDLGVFQLRKKLGPRWGRCLQTRRSFGYYLKIDQ